MAWRSAPSAELPRSPGISARTVHGSIAGLPGAGIRAVTAHDFQRGPQAPPGHFLTWSAADGLYVERYWDPAAVEVTDLDEEGARASLRHHLEDAVASHLESEVPLGAFLSGGVDSSAVVAMMCRASTRQVRTFSIGFREAKYDESRHAASVAKALGTDHTAVTLDPSATAILDRVARIYDEPFADSSALPTYLVSALAREQVTVSLSGDGGDELFGGYSWYPALAERPENPGAIAPIARLAAKAWPHGMPGRGRVLDWARTRRESLNARHASSLSPGDGGVLTRATSHQAPAVGDWFEATWSRVAHHDAVNQMTLVDLSHYMPDDILTKVDRASMAVSLEARVPLLHLPLVEFALSLRGNLKVRDGRTKYLFRRAIEDIIPSQVLQHPKQGFSIPLDQWLRQELGAELLLLVGLADRLPDLIDRAAIERVVRDHRAGLGRCGTLLWRLVVLRRWLGHLDAGDLARPTEPVSLAALMRTTPAVVS